MALNRSTGLRNKLLDTGSWRDIMALCFLNIYSGTRPTSADEVATPGAILLASITVNGDGATGLSWEASAASGAIQKLQSQVWQEDSILATGVATWFRIYEATDNPANASTTLARADGTVGVSGSDMNLSTVNLTLGVPLTLNNTTQFTIS